MSPPTIKMSDAAKSARLALFTFDSTNTLTISDPALPPLEFDDENTLVSPIDVEASSAALKFDCENTLTSELLPGPSPPLYPTEAVVIQNIVVDKANTWPKETQCHTCTHQPVRRPSIFVSTTTDEAIDRHARLLLLIRDSSTDELTKMMAQLRLELHSRQPSLTLQPPRNTHVDSGVAGSGMSSTPSSAVKPKRTPRLRDWNASNAETANASDADSDADAEA